MTLRVSDHALLRFLERAGGMDVERLRAELERSLARAEAAAVRIGVADYTIRADGVFFEVRAGTVATVLPLEASRERRRR